MINDSAPFDNSGHHERERNDFLDKYVLTADGEGAIEVLRTFRPTEQRHSLIIVPKSSRPIDRYDEYETTGFVFVTEPNTQYRVVVSAGDKAAVHDISHYILGGDAVLTGISYILTEARSAQPTLSEPRSLPDTDNAPLAMGLRNAEWVKIFSPHKKDTSVLPPMPDLLHYTDAERAEVVLPARWLRLIDRASNGGQPQSGV